MIKQTGLVHDLPSWRVADHVGPQGAQIILLGGSTDLSAAFPASIPTRDTTTHSCRRLPMSLPVMARDGWIMGHSRRFANDDAASRASCVTSISIYVNDYVAQWTQLYGQIGLVTHRTSSKRLR